MGRKVVGKRPSIDKIDSQFTSSMIPDRWIFYGQSQSPKLSNADTLRVIKEVKEINRFRTTIREVRERMESINKMVGGFGIEEINEGSVEIMYVNLGDTYDTTIVYDFNKQKARIGNWGTYIEIG